MKVIGARSALQTAVLAIVCLAGYHGDAADRAAKGGIQGKIEYCKDCHGLSGQGYRGYFAMPRLAGQQTEYLENQLRSFAERSRDKDLLIKMSRVHGLSPEMRTVLAAHFSELDPIPVGGGPRNLMATGKQIYEEGVLEANVPACAACHGPEAKGQGAIPRLAGQLHPYTIKTLTNWSKERGQSPTKDDTSIIMTPIAQSLTQAQIVALAAYLSYLK